MDREYKPVISAANLADVNKNSICESSCSSCYPDYIDDTAEYMFIPGSDEHVVLGELVQELLKTLTDHRTVQT